MAAAFNFIVMAITASVERLESFHDEAAIDRAIGMPRALGKGKSWARGRRYGDERLARRRISRAQSTRRLGVVCLNPGKSMACLYLRQY